MAQSADGILFDIVTLDETPLYPQVDGNSLLVDDDGNAYDLSPSLFLSDTPLLSYSPPLSYLHIYISSSLQIRVLLLYRGRPPSEH